MSVFETSDPMESVSLLVSRDDAGVSTTASEVGDVVDADVREAAGVDPGTLDAAVVAVASCARD